MPSEDMVREQALEWAVRTGDPAFADWDAFMLWLEADAAHARAYDAVTAAVSDGAELLATAAPANDEVAEPVAPTARRPWLAGGIAALLVIVMASWLARSAQPDFYSVQTAAGETRTVTLEPGTRVELAGGSQLVFDRKDTRFARLDKGQALFIVRHDADRPFEVVVGEERLVDLGTVFDVRRDANELVVAVSEGAVQFDPDGADVRIAPGEVLRHAAGSHEYSLSQVPLEQVGEWRAGRLTFAGASLEDVAAQLRRTTGIAYTAKGSATVSGSILVAPLRQDPAALGPLLGVTVRPEGERWVIVGR